MKYEKKIGLAIFCFFVFLIIFGATITRILTNQYPYPELKVFHQAFSLILSKFVDPIDENLLLEGAERGLLTALDPVNIYVPKNKVEKFKEWQNKTGYDCGIKLRKSGRFVYVSKVYPSSAADGIFKVGDVIEEVNGLKYPVYDFWELELELTGSVGKSLKIHYTPPESEESKEITLNIKPYNKIEFEIIYEEEYIKLKLNELNKICYKKLKQELEKIDKNKTLVLDLRGTDSLDYDSAILISELFVKEPFYIIYKDSKTSIKKKIPNEKYYGFKEIYIMQDQETFGAAEVLSMILRKKGNAILCGTQTFGYVGIPKIYQLSNNSLIYLTSSIILFEDEINIMKKGVKPDIEVKEAYLYQETYRKIEETLKEKLKEKIKKAA